MKAGLPDIQPAFFCLHFHLTHVTTCFPTESKANPHDFLRAALFYWYRVWSFLESVASPVPPLSVNTKTLLPANEGAERTASLWRSLS